MSQPTIKDVAKLAGVSISTVSRVMNNSKPVSPEARKKVLDAINKLQFKPNELARSLVMRRSNLIGVIVEDLGIEYMAQLIRGVEEIGRVYKYDILLSSSYGDDESLENAIDFLATKQVEGLIIITENISAEVLVKLRNRRIPFVLLDKYHDYNNIKTVKIDYKEEEKKLIEFLINKGHDNFLYINHDENNILNQSMLKGFLEATEENSKKGLVINCQGGTSDDGYSIGNEAKKIIESEGITAATCVNDEVAIGFINYCVDNNIKVPEDISIAGFGGSTIANIYRPKLTTVAVPYYDIGAIAIRALIKRIKEEEDILENDWIIEGQIVRRESTKSLS